ncbi:putative C6 zinc finger domain-containing protein [Rosellinia necatrix]|uniref:Putative C6 zinc finger domain-containing protein n=1 Tax=Rosellinia necatrix TaxID=77044 RepID=A0A1W2TUL1_ROSNE|nr:putative C6 zinc finger domain-containing protein [Rosellinia necatrix]
MANIGHPQFNNTLEAGSPPLARERTNSRDYTQTDEWDASKTPPSRFQKRKGSIYATPPSRDGHVERNRDAVEEFHKAHSKRWSISSAKSTGTAASNNNEPQSPTTTNHHHHQQQQQQQQKRHLFADAGAGGGSIDG